MLYILSEAAICGTKFRKTNAIYLNVIYCIHVHKNIFSDIVIVQQMHCYYYSQSGKRKKKRLITYLL